MSIQDKTPYSTIITCPICHKEHSKEYLEITSFVYHKEDNIFKEHHSITVYCNESDKGLTLYK